MQNFVRKAQLLSLVLMFAAVSISLYKITTKKSFSPRAPASEDVEVVPLEVLPVLPANREVTSAIDQDFWDTKRPQVAEKIEDEDMDSEPAQEKAPLKKRKR